MEADIEHAELEHTPGNHRPFLLTAFANEGTPELYHLWLCESRQFCTRQCSRDYERVKEANPHHPRHEPRCTPEMADKIMALLTREMPDGHLTKHLRRQK